MEDVLKMVSNYVLSAFLLLAGFAFLIFYAGGKGLEVQGKGMLLGSVLLIVIGILSLPFIVTKINKTIKIILTVLALLGVVFVARGVYVSITDEISFQNNMIKYNTGVIQKLKDIREAENAFAKIHGRFTPDIKGELAEFVKADVIPVPDSEGMFIESKASNDPNADPDQETIGVGNGSEQTYREKGYIIKYKDLDSISTLLEMDKDMLLQKIREDLVNYKIRDTSYTSIWNQKFAENIREKKNLPPVDLNTWHLNPQGEPFIIEVGSLDETIAGVTVKTPVIHVLDPTPYGRPNVRRDTLQFGSMEEAHTDGTWRRLQQ